MVKPSRSVITTLYVFLSINESKAHDGKTIMSIFIKKLIYFSLLLKKFQLFLLYRCEYNLKGSWIR